MYQKYHTDVIVLGSSERGESDSTVTLISRDFGVLRARATGVRSEKSKMRYAVQHYTRSVASLVKGKRGWRIAGATAKVLPGSGKGLSAFARISELVQRLVPGEEKNEYLFDVLEEAHRALMRGGEAVPVIEIVSVARVLFALGYISDEALKTTLFSHTQFGDEHIQEAEILKETMLKSINRAIADTHL
jgi:recombinational DNA repair protein (RecF pathway)